jgi:hypothetical protein
VQPCVENGDYLSASHTVTATQGIAPTATEARPFLAFRVGITGHRRLPDADPAKLNAVVGDVLDGVRRVLADLARKPEASCLYRPAPPILRLISALAEGADRVAATAAIERGWRLAAPLPFSRPDYENDFPDSVKEFRRLLAHAEANGEAVELDGHRVNAPEAYAEVGRFVLRHSDLLIAIWDGHHEVGVGGTGQIVDEGRALGVPIVHIAAAAPHAVHLLFDETSAKTFDRTALATMLESAILPSWPTDKRKHRKAAEIHFSHETVRFAAPGSANPGDERFSAPNRLPTRLFPALNRLLGGRVQAETQPVIEPDPPLPPETPALRERQMYFQRADVLATHYANVHRSAFIGIYIVGSVSLLAAFTAQFLHAFPIGARLSTILEAAGLVTALMLFLAEQHWRWRERWLDCRALAELLRQSDLLAMIGTTPLTGCLDRLSDMHPERGWVPWLVHAITRSAGIIGVRYDTVYLRRLRDYAADTRFASQISYHERTTKRNARVNQRLRGASNVLFGLTMVAIMLELADITGQGLAWPAWLAGILPVLSAASFGIRNQAEFEIVVHRSARLRERLVWEQQRIRRLDGDRLTSANLGQAIQCGAHIMQADTTEWAAIFEVKETEVV